VEASVIKSHIQNQVTITKKRRGIIQGEYFWYFEDIILSISLKMGIKVTRIMKDVKEETVAEKGMTNIMM
jgi:GTP cyclohydrolase FolE2